MLPVPRAQDMLTPLHWAARTGCPEAIELLVQRYADMERGDADGWTPLHHAVSQQHLDCVRTLLAHKCNVDARDNVGARVRCATIQFLALHSCVPHRCNVDAGNNMGLL